MGLCHKASRECVDQEFITALIPLGSVVFLKKQEVNDGQEHVQALCWRRSWLRPAFVRQREEVQSHCCDS